MLSSEGDIFYGEKRRTIDKDRLLTNPQPPTAVARSAPRAIEPHRQPL